MKYRVYRRSLYSGQVEVLKTKCSGHWCSEKYLELYPKKVWKFTKQGAKGIVNRESACNQNYEYWMEPAE